MTAKAQAIEGNSKVTTLEEYFAYEAQAEGRHEFVGGKIEAMAYTSEEHATIVHNLDVLLGNCLRKKDCKVYPGDRMLYVEDCRSVFYPDLLLVCGEPQYHQATKNMKATLNPSVVIEILSDSTEYLDKTAKTRCYKKDRQPAANRICFPKGTAHPHSGTGGRALD